MGTQRTALRPIARLVLSCLAACGCGRTVLNATLDRGAGGSDGTSAMSFAAGGTNTLSITKASGGLASGGYFTSGDTTLVTGGSSSTTMGGALATGGTTYRRVTVGSNRATYSCPTEPNDLDPCVCDELPCYCNYVYYYSDGTRNCTAPGAVCVYSSGSGYGCFGGVWRVLGGGVGSSCSCVDFNTYFGTGGASGTGGTSGTDFDAGPSTGGKSAADAGTTQGGTTATGGTSSNTAPIITSTGGSYSCPASEPLNPQATCDCTDPPCECDYTYTFSSESDCGDGTACQRSLSYDYRCISGVWQAYGEDDSDCGCHR